MPETFRISLAQWSLHRTFRSGMPVTEFARVARDLGLDAIEYVNQFFSDRANDRSFLRELGRRADDHGVRQLLIMCDGEGRVGDPDPAMRRRTVENHRKWIDAAAFLGCRAIRVNAASEGTYEEQLGRAAHGLSALGELGAR